jgi:hypothetical protein
MSDKKDDITDIFGPPIDVYGDEDALEDGVIVDLSELGLVLADLPVNRMTRALWFSLIPFVHEAQEYLKCEFKADCRVIEHVSIPVLKSMLQTKIKLAVATGSDARILKIPPDIWAVQNEVGGYTLMFPSDY